MSASIAMPAEGPGAGMTEAELERLGRPIKGPSALGSDPRRLWGLTWALAKTEFKLAFFGSALGYLWQLMRPLLLFSVLYVVFSHVGKFNTGIKFWPASLLLGIVFFSFLSAASGGAVVCLVTRENLVRKVEFPRLAVPLATVLTALLTLILSMVPVFVFLLAAGGSVRWSWLELPLLIALLTCFTTGLGMLLSVLYVRYRDVRPIWEVVMQMTFYASGIFFSIVGISPVTVSGLRINFAHVLMASPFAAILQQARHAMIDPSQPSAASAIGGNAMLLIPIGIGLAVIVIGFLAFHREAPRVAEQL